MVRARKVLRTVGIVTAGSGSGVSACAGVVEVVLDGVVTGVAPADEGVGLDVDVADGCVALVVVAAMSDELPVATGI